MKSIVALTAALNLIALICLAETKPESSPAAHKPDEVLARVGDHLIRWEEVDVAVTVLSQQLASYGRSASEAQIPSLRYDVLQQMITHVLVLEDARGHEPANLDEQVKKQVETIKVQRGGEEAFNAALKEMNLTPAYFARRVREDMIVSDRLQHIAEAQVKVTPEDVRSFYDDNQEKFKMPERVRASHILIQVPQDATADVKKAKRTQIESVQTMLKNGDKFTDLARKFSEDPVSARNGGDLGFFGRGQMVSDFEAVAFDLKTNEVSDIVTTKFGYHILLVTEHQPAGLRGFDESKADIEKYLRYNQGQEIAAQHIKKLRDAGKIEVLLPKPEPVAATPAPTVAVKPVKPSPTVETKPVAAPKP